MISFLLSDGQVVEGTHSAMVEAATDWQSKVIGIQTIIDESRVHPADLSSKYLDRDDAEQAVDRFVSYVKRQTRYGL